MRARRGSAMGPRSTDGGAEAMEPATLRGPGYIPCSGDRRPPIHGTPIESPVPSAWARSPTCSVIPSPCSSVASTVSVSASIRTCTRRPRQCTRNSIDRQSAAGAVRRQGRHRAATTRRSRRSPPARARPVPRCGCRRRCRRRCRPRSIAAVSSKVALGQRDVAEPRRDQRVQAAAERAAVPAARLVVAEVGRLHRGVEGVRQHREQRHHIRLLQHLRALRPLAPQDHVHRHGPAGVPREIDVLQPEVAVELLEQPALRVEAGDHGVARPRATPASRPSSRPSAPRAPASAPASAGAAGRPSPGRARCSSAP